MNRYKNTNRPRGEPPAPIPQAVQNSNPIDQAIEALLRRMCAGLISYPEHLEILCAYSGGSLSKYNMRAHAADAPRLMGKGGDRWRALRFLCEKAAEKFGRTFSLEALLQNKVGSPEPFPSFTINAHWPKRETQKLLEDVCSAVYKFPPKITLEEIGAGSAVFRIELSDREPLDENRHAAGHLQALFSAIGITNGCVLSLDIYLAKGGQP